MKRLFYTLSLASLIFAWGNRLSAQCTTDAYGQYPSATFTPACTGSAESITTLGYAGEYSLVNVTSGTMYTFSSSLGGDYITIINNSNSSAVAFGTTPVMWTANFTGVVRFWTHASGPATCGTNSTFRTRAVACGSGGGGGGGCTNGTSFGSAVINTSGTAVQISSCSYAGEYSTISGAVSGQTLKFTSSVGTDYITVHSSSPSGPIIAMGTTPLTFNNTHTGTLYAHWNTSAACGTQSSCRTTTVQCTSCMVSAPANDLCSNATMISCGQTLSGTTIGATFDNAGTCTTSNTQPGVWYTIVGTGGNITLSLCGASFDTKISVYTGSCAALSCFAGNDDFCSLQSQVTFLSTLGTTYYVLVHQFSSTSGAFSLAATCTSPPCAAPGTPAASSVTSNSASVSWAAAPGATSYDWSVGTSSSCPNGATTNTAATSVNLSGLTPNTTYTFCVRTSTCGGGSSSSYVSTTFTTAPLPNDACAGAITVTCGQTVNGNTTGAASDSGLGSCGGSTPGNGIWYKLVGNGSQATVSLCGSSYDTKVHVYSGSCGSLSCVASNDNFCGLQSQVSFNAFVGNTYYILVSGFGTSTGAFTMNISCLCGPALGAPWTVTNIGASNGGAIENVCDGTIDVKATNYGSPMNDIQTYAWQTLCGNGFIKAKLENVTNGGWGGIMFRESNAGGSKKIALRSQLTSAVIRDLRATTNGVAQQQQFPRPNTPQWLRLTRNGNVFLGETSIDGVNWDFTFTTTLVLPNCIEVGLFAQSINVNTTVTAVFSNIMGVSTSPPVPTLADGGSNGQVETQEVFSLFPNPAQNEVNVKLENYIGKQVNLTVYNNLGQAVLVRDIDEVLDSVERLPLNGLTNGVYYVMLRAEGLPSQTKKLIVGSQRP